MDDLLEVVGSEITFVGFHRRHVAHVPRVVAARDGIDAAFLAHLVHPIEHKPLVDDWRRRRSQKPARDPRVVRHAVATAAPSFRFRLLQGAKRNPRHVHRIYALVVRAHHQQACGGEVSGV